MMIGCEKPSKLMERGFQQLTNVLGWLLLLPRCLFNESQPLISIGHRCSMQERRRVSDTSLTANMGHVKVAKTTQLRDKLTAMKSCSLFKGEHCPAVKSGGGSDKDQGAARETARMTRGRLILLRIAPADAQPAQTRPKPIHDHGYDWDEE